ncbi:MAG: endopeptidase La [Bdellovibrionales bacterium RIFOXYB1_FULL_37_110]|nr:MAG: endopeptidase La [Bdellovibrionales bacterium RIFOXYA1_FULL_38_20]OFZ47813.1 MAG: endopeptidase La [Bdellovibrionales bacterium RIFOXYC1_FULL_37_79]OFZ57560.1 MAG: endopeptidase La [Bdellovibrionales bacterium RIFOXYB1_FULL_37_110]OFZ61628.1 MAG: endopeptidase La [Bdellovibrionales bacterium RIFOXYD1_FULL_36_51]
MVTNYNGESIEFKEVLPLLPIRDIVVYPFMILPLFVGRESSIEAVDHALNKTNQLILLASQKDILAECPEPHEIYEMGTVAMIMRMRKLPDGRVKILVQGLSKARITEFVKKEPCFITRIEKVEDLDVNGRDPLPVNALMRTIREQLEKIITHGKVLSSDILMVLDDIQDPGRLADLVASNLNLHVVEAQIILEILDPIERLNKINEILSRELEIMAMQAKIRNVAQDEITKSQKEYFLKEQIKAIKNELGEDPAEEEGNEFAEIKEKIIKAKMPLDTEKESLKQLSRLEKMHPDSSESSIIRNYLDWLTDLPWSITTEEQFNLDEAQRILDEDHFDLHKVKERILEYLAVKRLKGSDMKGPILCLAGPPGVGKTSLGKSIARAAGRKFARISLGGVKDEAEIRGHRRTYVGSMPGRIIQAIKQAGSNNPVMLLDEVDKMANDIKGDPASALLEVLDPEQNNSFRDHYLNVPFDLSNTIFIATVNMLENIPPALKDRMEVISLSGYSQEEKLTISRKFLIPKQMQENGICEEHIEFSDESVKTVIRNFTCEAGLRNLERQIGALCRKVAMKIAKGDIAKTHLLADTVEKFLGPPLFTKEDELTEDEIGIATGLAWTSVGGEILRIETTRMKGKGITLTGRLGEVMKESAQTAIGFIRSKAYELGVDEQIFEDNEIHLHIPAGAIPKDGPSAGITLATALVSLLTNTAVKSNVAMTGEITLTGKVLPIGGLKEKALAAMRMNIKTIIIPWKNKKDLIEIPEEYRLKIKFIPVKTFEEVLNIALVDWKERQKILHQELSIRGKIKMPVAA